MNAQIVEAGHHQYRDSEGHAGHTNLGSIPSASEGQSKHGCTGDVIESVIRVGKSRVGVRLIGLEAKLMKLSFLVRCQRGLQSIHFYIINKLLSNQLIIQGNCLR